MRDAAWILAVGSILWSSSAEARGKGRLMEATAFARARHATSSGSEAHEGIVAADPKILPMGSKIRVSGTEEYDGVYLVTDTGAAVKGRHIDLYLPSVSEAKQFGRKMVRVQVLRVGKGKRDVRIKDNAKIARRE